MKNIRTVARVGALTFIATAALTAAAVPAIAAPAASAPIVHQVSGPALPSWVPADFPIPPGANVAVNTGRYGEADLILNGITDQQAYDFYSRALPEKGFPITKDATTPAYLPFKVVSLEFNGRGVYGTVGSAAGVVGVNIHQPLY